MENSGGVSDAAAQAGHLFLGTLLGAGAGALIAVVALVLIRYRGRKSPTATQVFRRTRLPMLVATALLGAWIGFVLSQPDVLSILQQHMKHALLILLIVSAGWLVYAALGVLRDAAILTDVKTGRDARRFRTQAAVLRRALQALTVFLTIVFVLLTFPEARAPMASLLASAGVLSVILGIAAQSSLGNMFAGLQLAFSDALRVGDTVVVPEEPQPGTVEEVTLTYIVVRTWDERRLVIPSTQFTTQPFQNWTRRASTIMGVVEIQLDWSAPIAEIRAEVERLLFSTDLWDKRSWAVQVDSINQGYINVRIVISAPNWPKLWDLRSYIRENVLAWIRENAPWSIPRERLIGGGPETDGKAWPTDELHPEYLADPTYSGLAGGGYVREAQQKAVEKQLIEEQKESSGKAAAAKPIPELPPVSTPVVVQDPSDPKEIDKALQVLPDRADPYDYPVPKVFTQLNKGHMLFSGTPEAEERASRYNGPGDDVIKLREQRAAQRDLDGNAKLPPEVAAQAKELPDVDIHTVATASQNPNKSSNAKGQEKK